MSARRVGLYLLTVMEGARAGVPHEWVRAHLYVESGGRDWITPEPGGLTSYGVMQILPETARQMGYQGADADLASPALSIRYGALYLAWQLRRYGGDFRRATIAYKAGSWDHERDGHASNVAYHQAVMECLYRC